jgi:hypothetical protein
MITVPQEGLRRLNPELTDEQPEQPMVQFHHRSGFTDG